MAIGLSVPCSGLVFSPLTVTPAATSTAQSPATWFVPAHPDPPAVPDTRAQYRAKDKPFYRPGHAVILAYIAVGWACSLALLVLLKRENARRAAGARDEEIAGAEGKHADGARNGRFASVADARREKGDMWSGFQYTL
jgi:hypothetical protein